jgi:hypothetical protein
MNVSRAQNCVPFDRQRSRAAEADRAPVEPSADLFGELSPAQYAFLSGVFAVLAAHGAEALTRSCEMVIERFGRGHAR